MDHQVLDNRRPGHAGRGRVVPLGLDIQRLPDHPGNLGHDRVEPLDVPHPDREVLRDHPHQIRCFCCSAAERLLDQGGNAGRQDLGCHRMVELCRDADAHGIHAVQEIVNGCRDLCVICRCHLCRCLPVHIRHEEPVHLLELRVDADMVLSHHADTDHADIHSGSSGHLSFLRQ